MKRKCYRNHDRSITVKDVASHRNGVCGEPFHVVLFRCKNTQRDMVGIVFGTSRHCAVLDVNMAAAGNVRFAENSWRGDEYEHMLRLAIRDSVFAPDAESMMLNHGWSEKHAKQYSREVPRAEFYSYLKRQRKLKQGHFSPEPDEALPTLRLVK